MLRGFALQFIYFREDVEIQFDYKLGLFLILGVSKRQDFPSDVVVMVIYGVLCLGLLVLQMCLQMQYFFILYLNLFMQILDDFAQLGFIDVDFENFLQLLLIALQHLRFHYTSMIIICNYFRIQ